MDKLDEILEHYSKFYTVESSIEEVKAELLSNNVKVEKDSFFCPVWNEEAKAWILLAGTKHHADIWVLKKIIKLIKSGDTIYSMLNGNSDYLIKILSRYDIKVFKRDGETSFIGFNIKEKLCQ